MPSDIILRTFIPTSKLQVIAIIVFLIGAAYYIYQKRNN